MDRLHAAAPWRSPCRPAAARRQPPRPPQRGQKRPCGSAALSPDRVETGLSPPAEPSLPEKVLAVHGKLSESAAPHAFGGALALAYYAEPRATIDIDLNVFLSPADYPAVVDALEALGAGDGPSPEVVERDGQCRLWWGRTPIDLFFAYDALHDAMRGAVRIEPFANATIPILSPEHLLICKAIFNRPKDWLDIEQIVVTVEDLEAEEILSWLDRIVGRDDPRRERAAGALLRG